MLQEVTCNAGHFFADFCKKWAISAMDIVFRLKGAILQLKTASAYASCKSKQKIIGGR